MFDQFSIHYKINFFLLRFYEMYIFIAHTTYIIMIYKFINIIMIHITYISYVGYISNRVT